MEATTKATPGTEAKEPEKKKLSFGQKFMNFLMYGGFIVLLIAAVAVVILVEKLMK
jgi:hypothetical protein